MLEEPHVGSVAEVLRACVDEAWAEHLAVTGAS
jgi:hypothetical protein